MANNSGTLLIAPVRPTSTADTFPSAYANELLGGWHEVAQLADRDALPADRREVGMACWVEAVATLYILTGGTTNANWVAFSAGGGGGGGGATTVTFNQSSASASWTIIHNLSRFPSVTVVDSAGTTVEGDVQYLSANALTVAFAYPFAGVAYLN